MTSPTLFLSMCLCHDCCQLGLPVYGIHVCMHACFCVWAHMCRGVELMLGVFIHCSDFTWGTVSQWTPSSLIWARGPHSCLHLRGYWAPCTTHGSRHRIHLYYLCSWNFVALIWLLMAATIIYAYWLLIFPLVKCLFNLLNGFKSQLTTEWLRSPLSPLPQSPQWEGDDGLLLPQGCCVLCIGISKCLAQELIYPKC